MLKTFNFLYFLCIENTKIIYETFIKFKNIIFTKSQQNLHKLLQEKNHQKTVHRREKWMMDEESTRKTPAHNKLI